MRANHHYRPGDLEVLRSHPGLHCVKSITPIRPLHARDGGERAAPGALPESTMPGEVAPGRGFSSPVVAPCSAGLIQLESSHYCPVIIH